VVLEHLRHVHAEHVVRAEDEDLVRLLVGDEVEVLVDRVGASLVPVEPGPHLGRHHVHELSQEAAQPPGTREVVVQRVGLVLGEHLHLQHTRVGEVRQNEVDDPEATAEGDRRLGALAGERLEPRPCASGHDHRQGLAHAPVHLDTAPVRVEKGGERGSEGDGSA
jgi:hypothetical protein